MSKVRNDRFHENLLKSIANSEILYFTAAIFIITSAGWVTLKHIKKKTLCTNDDDTWLLWQQHLWENLSDLKYPQNKTGHSDYQQFLNGSKSQLGSAVKNLHPTQREAARPGASEDGSLRFLRP